MHYGTIKLNDIANGEGVRVSLFVSGCTNHCKECFNPETWNFEYGKPFTEETENYILDNLKPYFINGLTLLGGEPFEPKNQAVLLPFVKRVREMYPNKNIWAYSGFRLEDELLREGAYPNCEYTLELLKNIDILVDGRFDRDLKKITLNFRGSSNQRIIDVQQSLKEGKVVLSPLNN
ncbi:MAG: anaerobic ribonucleoside-triphosphate reductase activating protein [Clostridia bacterium]|nr:anaerobic ribonucleoside-triphosphate reductase activating protein [Clostridia bacterium]